MEALQQNYEGRIVFLCQMVEEPLVRVFIQRRCDHQTSEIDYLICPISVERLAFLFETGNGQDTSEATVPIQAVTRDHHIRHLEKLATEDDLTGLKSRCHVWEFDERS